MGYEVYLHGQILGTHSFLLKGEFVQPDEYAEIKQKYFLPGGETGTAATVLASLGAQVKMDGTHIGTQVAPLLKEFYKDKSVDLSSLYFDPEYEGLMDYVVIAGLVRSPMGFFQALYESGEKRWNMPKEEDIAGCKVVGIDPYFQEETQAVAELCVKHGKPYVTIDSRHDSFLHQNCAINVVSKECTHAYLKDGYSMEKIFEKLVETTDGLVVITTGEKDMLYGRKGQPMKRMKPFNVEVKSTLGAGDTFKAGCVYGLLKGMMDEEIVRFASACSAIAISRFPLPLNPPTLEEVKSLLETGKL
ncbi:MAG: carbohydrate kinase family protein [Lachnospiraceae bacterium]|nr:carbohydrate kinase family protein [Lachnospiraceae bacterium]